MTSERDRIVDELQRAWNGDPWHGSPVAALLDGIDASQASAHPVRDAHSVWEIVLHLAAWADEVTRRLEGHTPGQPLDGDWPAVGDPTPERWRAARDRLEGALATLVEAVGELPPERLDELVGESDYDAPLGSGVPVAVMLHGLAQHLAYHGGQIGLLRKALGI
jgi:uncharacterized damage-inducible protein DinB